jgi:hypothetical protein
MAISDEEAAVAWKKAQGQVQGKSGLGHVKPVALVFVGLFALCFGLGQFVLNKGASLGENLFIGVICAMAVTLRWALRSMRRR